MSWRSIVFPDILGIDRAVLLENDKIYYARSVEVGGNYVIYEVDLATGNVVAKDTGIPVPSTDPHYNLNVLLPTSDKTKLIGCWARWTGLNCYEIDIATGAGRSLGSVAPAGESGLNYPHFVKIREDAYFMTARTADNRYTLFKFKGAPEQITDGTLWEALGDVVNDTGVTPSSCPEGSLNYTYLFLYADLAGYFVMAGTTRCPSGYIGKFAVALFDVLREKLYNTQFQPVEYGLKTYDSPLTITPSGIPWSLSVQHTVRLMHAIDLGNRKMALVAWTRDSDYVDRELIYIVDMATRTAEAKRCPGGLDRCAPVLFTSEGKIIMLYKDSADNKLKLGVYNPATASVESILYTLATSEVSGYRHTCLATEDVLSSIPGMVTLVREVLVPSGDLLNKFLAKPKRITVTAEGAGSVRVQAGFHRAPSQIKVQLFNAVDGTLSDLETLPGATSIDRTYTVTAERYRIRVVGMV